MKIKLHFLFLTLVLLIACSATNATTITWTNVAGGNWSLAANWSPQAVPGSGDTANITNAGTYAVTLDVNPNVDSLAIGGAASGVQTVQGNGFTLAASNATINAGGVLQLQGSSMTGTISVASGGQLAVAYQTLDAQVTVEEGGELLLLGGGYSSSIGQNGYAGNTNCWLWVQEGGEVNAEPSGYSDYLYLYGMMTNQGSCDMTNSGFAIENNGTSSQSGGLLNLPGGVIGLNSGAAILGAGGFDFVLNQGHIDVTNGSSTISVDNLTNLATVATVAGTGTLRIGTYNGLGSLTGTYNTAAGTIIQFVGGDSPGTSAGAGLTLGGAGQYEFVQGWLTLPTNVIPGVTLDGGTLILGAGFQGGAITNLTATNVTLTSPLPINGTLTLPNSTYYTTNTIGDGSVVTLVGGTLYGSLSVASGGQLAVAYQTLDAQVTVEEGGELLLLGGGYSSSIGQNGYAGNTNCWLWVQEGGEVNAEPSGYSDYLYLYGMMTNQGSCDMTNSGFAIENNGTSSQSGGLLNLSGGVIGLNSGAAILGAGGFDFVLNQGHIDVTNGSSTISVDNLTNLATVATVAGTGTLRIGTYNGLGSLTGTYNTAAGTIIQFVGSDSPGTSAGAGLTLGGAGQYEFVQGWLTLPTNVIPGVTLDGGTLILGAGFQGGAITNLTATNVTLTSPLPINGTLTLPNSTYYTTNTIGDGSVVTLVGGTLYGSLSVASGGQLAVAYQTLDAQVTVEEGGELLLLGGGYSSSIGQNGYAGNTNCWLWVQEGGEVNAEPSGYSDYLYLYGMMTNQGSCDMTNSGFAIENNGTSSQSGGLLNLPGGVIDLWNNAGISGQGGYDYLVNQGTINLSSGAGTSGVLVDNITNSGTLGALHGTLQLQDTDLILQPSETFSVGLNSASDYGTIAISGNVTPAGAFHVQLENGFFPAVGDSFTVLTYGSISGNFTGFNLLADEVAWQPVFSSTALTLVVQPLIAPLEGTNLVFNADGTPGTQSVPLSRTNLAVPLANWVPVATNTFDVTGYFSYTNNLVFDKRQEFFIQKLQ